MEDIVNILRAEKLKRQARIMAPLLNEPSDELEKGKAAQQGEVRTWNGQKFKKQGEKWVPVTGGRKKAPQPEKKDKKKKPETSSAKQEADKKTTPTEDINVSSSEKGQLRRIKTLIEEGNLDAANDLAATLSDDAKNVIPEKVWARMHERTSPTSQSVKDEVNEKIATEDNKERFKNWVDKNKKMFDTGEHAHPDRSKAAKFLRGKAKGFVKGLKTEIEHIKESGTAIKKVLTGKASEITHHEKKALKKVGISLAMTAGTMLATGGIGAFTHGFASTAAHFGIHFAEHGLLETAGMAAIFAKAEAGEEISEKDMDKLLKELVEKYADWFENGDWSGMLNEDNTEE